MAISHELINLMKFITVFSLILTLNAYKEIKAYRLIQYESGENLYGSQYSTLQYTGSYYKSDNLRKIALVPLIDVKDISEIEKVLKSNANALLFILPKKIQDIESFSSLIDQIQILLHEQTLYIPIYFVSETEELNGIVDILRNEHKQSIGEEKKDILTYLGINQNLLHFSLSASDPRKIETLNLENFYGFLEGSQSSSGSQNPIIAIVTNYDNLSIAPDMPNGLNSNGSGIAVFLELIRILSKFYESYENVLKYDILFVLTSGGALNYEGTQSFINSLDSAILENLNYVLCLDSLGNIDNELNIHISRLPKNNEETAQRLYKIFNTTSENMNFNLNYIKKKVFLTNKVVPWEHEQFSKKKILSGTISGSKIPTVNNFNKTLLIDNNVEINNIKKNTKFLAESFLSFLFDYDIKNFTIFKDDENLIDQSNLETFVNYLKKISRFPLNIQRGSSFNNYLFNFLNLYLTKTQRQTFEFKDLKFFDTNSGSIKVYTVKSKLIDLYLLLLILIYLLLVYIYTKGFKNFITGIKTFFDSEE